MFLLLFPWHVVRIESADFRQCVLLSDLEELMTQGWGWKFLATTGWSDASQSLSALVGYILQPDWLLLDDIHFSQCHCHPHVPHPIALQWSERVKMTYSNTTKTKASQNPYFQQASIFISEEVQTWPSTSSVLGVLTYGMHTALFWVGVLCYMSLHGASACVIAVRYWFGDGDAVFVIHPVFFLSNVEYRDIC